MKAEDIPAECLAESQFTKVLAATLCSEIAEFDCHVGETEKAIQYHKDAISQAVFNRKQLKRHMQERSQQNQVLAMAVESLSKEMRNRSMEIELAKNQLDDLTLKERSELRVYGELLQKYHDTWQKYQEEYERFPLAVKRRECETNREKLKHRLMLREHKISEKCRIIKQTCDVDKIRTRVEIIELSRLKLKHSDNKKYLERIKSENTKFEEELRICDYQVKRLREDYERRERAKFDMAKMPPPRLDMSLVRSIMYQGNDERTNKSPKSSRSSSVYRRGKASRDDTDSASVNTLMFEEMCADVDDEYGESKKCDQVIKVCEEIKSPQRSFDRTNSQSVLDPVFTENDRTKSVRQTESRSFSRDQSADVIERRLQTLDIEKERKQSDSLHENTDKRKSDTVFEENDNEVVEIISQPEEIKETPIRQSSTHQEAMPLREICFSPVMPAIPLKNIAIKPETPKTRREIRGTSVTGEVSIARMKSDLSIVSDIDSRPTSPKMRRIEMAEYTSTPYVRYAARYASSGNLSNFTEEQWLETPRDVKETPGEYTPFTSWKNWTPMAGTSMRSFSMSSICSKDNDDLNSDEPTRSHQNVLEEKSNDNIQMNMFFNTNASTNAQNRRDTFL